MASYLFLESYLCIWLYKLKDIPLLFSLKWELLFTRNNGIVKLEIQKNKKKQKNKQRSHNTMNTGNTPYDDVFRTLLNDCSKLILPVINEIFGEHYTGEETIVFSPNEHFLNKQDGIEEERITDTSFQVVGKETKKYHWECQSTDDSSMLVRFFEYDAQIALDQGELTGSILTVTFPHSAVLFLRHGKATPEEMKVVIKTPGTDAMYQIPVVKAQTYGIEEIFEKKLLFLIPFYIFSHESQFEVYNTDERKLKELQEEYGRIKNQLEELAVQRKIEEYTKCTIMDMSRKVLESIAKKYQKVREGVTEVMGGRVLEYEAKTIKNEGWLEGKVEGYKEGKIEVLFDLVENHVFTIKEAASYAGLTVEEFSNKIEFYKGKKKAN